MSQPSKYLVEQSSLLPDSNLWYINLVSNLHSCTYLLAFLDLDVSITSSPSGPTYPASSWIEFQCHVTSGSGVYSYKWRIYCSSTNTLIEESIAGPQTIFRMKSTPSTCTNQVECVAEDMVLPLSGSISLSIVTVTGRVNAHLKITVSEVKFMC